MIDALGDRMKGYEAAARMYLPRRMPVIIRVDGRAFHTLTRGCEKPFDGWLKHLMDETACTLCKEIDGAQLAYVQSDEISILMHNYKKLNTSPWFDNAVEKIVSVSAGVASAAFTYNCLGNNKPPNKMAVFDARVFVLPEAEVCNYFIWRQRDAIRNAIHMVARTKFSDKELHSKNIDEIQAMLETVDVFLPDYPLGFRRGRCALRYVAPDSDGTVVSKWAIDNDIPLFGTFRDYINRWLAVEEE